MSRWNIGWRRHRHERPSHFRNSLHELAQRVDRDTAASVTVVLRGSSGSYRDVACLFGAAVAWLGLIILLALPWSVLEWAVPFDVAGLFLLSAWICSRTRLRRWLTSRKRRRRQVRTAVHAAFIEEGAWHAPRNQGVLIYWSHLERQLDVVAALGVQARVPAHEWNVLVHALKRAPLHEYAGKAFLEGLTALGELLAKHLPPVPHEIEALKIGGAR
jgi:putative membrane protein